MSESLSYGGYGTAARDRTRTLFGQTMWYVAVTAGFFALGLALLLFAAAVARAAGVPRPIAYLMGLSGLTYLVQGWVVGSEGFSGTHTTLILLAWALSLAWMIWLVVVAWRMQDSGARRLADEGAGRPTATSSAITQR